MKRGHLIVALLAAFAAAPLSGCASKPKVQLANITPGTMPPGETFQGVWFNPLWGELHLIQSGQSVTGRYLSKEHGRFGRVSGTISGDVIKFSWDEKKAGAIAMGETRGHGYWKYEPHEPPDTPSMKGEWGNEDNEVGGGEWDLKKLKDRQPDPNAAKAEDDPTVDTGWDSSPTPSPTPPKK